MFAIASIAGSVSLQHFATTQLVEEAAPAARSAMAVAAALNAALQTSDHPQATLDAFAQSLGASGTIRFRRPGLHPPEAQTASGTVPGWFLRFLATPELKTAFPIMAGGKQVGDIVVAPDMTADVHEKWIGFLAIAGSGIALMLLTWGIAHFTARSVLKPLQDLGDGLARMRSGDYTHPIAASGPPEIRRSAQQANELAITLDQLDRDNQRLLRRIVSMQDDERQDMARELHDELGPLLFGIRANTVALLESIPFDQAKTSDTAEGVLRSVEALQHANRRILDRLKPLYIEELGLQRSIETLLLNAKAQSPALDITSQIDGALNGVDGLLSLTIYRVIQESITNVLRHAGATAMHVKAGIEDCEIVVDVSDDGAGFPADLMFGRGLTGMRERARALSGTLELLREKSRTCVRCRLPAGDAVSNDQRAEQERGQST